MLERNRFSLKEWAVVVRALLTGRQVVLLRKGGIEDEDETFRLEHSEFFLYPTFEHQHRKFLRPEFLPDFERAVAEQTSHEDISISGYATVADCIPAGDLEKLGALKPYHVWNDEYIQMRFNYKPELPLYILVVRAFSTTPTRVPYRPEYRGCKSWVELDLELSTAGATPALADTEFNVRRVAIRGLLGQPGNSPTVL